MVSITAQVAANLECLEALGRNIGRFYRPKSTHCATGVGPVLTYRVAYLQGDHRRQAQALLQSVNDARSLLARAISNPTAEQLQSARFQIRQARSAVARLTITEQRPVITARWEVDLQSIADGLATAYRDLTDREERIKALTSTQRAAHKRLKREGHLLPSWPGRYADPNEAPRYAARTLQALVNAGLATWYGSQIVPVKP